MLAAESQGRAGRKDRTLCGRWKMPIGFLPRLVWPCGGRLRHHISESVPQRSADRLTARGQQTSPPPPPPPPPRRELGCALAPSSVSNSWPPAFDTIATNLVECCFTSTETVGLLGTGAQDVHFDFHTAPELCDKLDCIVFIKVRDSIALVAFGLFGLSCDELHPLITHRWSR